MTLESPGKTRQTVLDNCNNYEEAATSSEKSCQVSSLSSKVTAYGGQLMVRSGH